MQILIFWTLCNSACWSYFELWATCVSIYLLGRRLLKLIEWSHKGNVFVLTYSKFCQLILKGNGWMVGCQVSVTSCGNILETNRFVRLEEFLGKSLSLQQNFVAATSCTNLILTWFCATYCGNKDFHRNASIHRAINFDACLVAFTRCSNFSPSVFNHLQQAAKIQFIFPPVNELHEHSLYLVDIALGTRGFAHIW